jgi:hypothetical protein
LLWYSQSLTPAGSIATNDDRLCIAIPSFLQALFRIDFIPYLPKGGGEEAAEVLTNQEEDLDMPLPFEKSYVSRFRIQDSLSNPHRFLACWQKRLASQEDCTQYHQYKHSQQQALGMAPAETANQTGQPSISSYNHTARGPSHATEKSGTSPRHGGPGPIQ